MTDSPIRKQAMQKRCFRTPGPLWEFYSPRLQKPVSGTGTLRLEHSILIECDPTVDTYTPVCLLEEHGGEKRQPHSIDSLVTYRDGRKVAHTIAGTSECTPQDDIFERERAWSAAHGYIHRTLRKEEIRTSDKLLFNCFTMFPWLSDIHQPPDQDTHTVLGVLAFHSSGIQIADLARLALCDRETVLAVVFRAYVRGLVQILDIRTKPLQYDSVVGRSNA